MAKRYNISDGKLILTLQEGSDGWYTVTSPTDPAMITQAKTIAEAFQMARDAFTTLSASRQDAGRWKGTSKVSRRRAAV